MHPLMGEADRSLARPSVTSGWGWLGLLRIGLGGVMGIYALAYQAPRGVVPPPSLLPISLLLAAIPFTMGIAQLLPRWRSSRRMAVVAVPIDVAVVLGTLALYAFDPRRYLIALVVVVQAEAGAVLGVRLGLVAWAIISASYVAIENWSASLAGEPLAGYEIALRVGVGLILALGGGVLSEELSGERRRRLAERERDLEALEEAERRYRSLVERLPAVPYVDALGEDAGAAAGRTLYMGPQMELLSGMPAEAWAPGAEGWGRAIHPDDRTRVLREKDRTAAAGQPFRGEYRLVGPDERVVWVRDETTVIRDAEGRPTLRQGVLIDITERRRADEEVQYLAYHDQLTGLPNRAMFEELLGRTLARSRRQQTGLAVLYVDLDDFKDVNDSLGHAAGDELLRELGARLQGVLRESDLVARHGGDEFLVLLPDLPTGTDWATPRPSTTAATIAARIHGVFEQPFDLRGQKVTISASVGASLYPGAAEDPDGLLAAADEAMYRSKRRGPGGTEVVRDLFDVSRAPDWPGSPLGTTPGSPGS
jgi:diguanylate cyclase (GGDEF)-like protein/PAS domain S-box-containing protein